MSKVDTQIKKEFVKLKHPFSVMVVIDPSAYQSGVGGIVSYLMNTKKMNGIYLTINRVCEQCINSFKKMKIKNNNMFFIDAISKMANPRVGGEENIAYVASPNSLTEMGIATTTVLQQEIENRVFVLERISIFISSRLSLVPAPISGEEIWYCFVRAFFFFPIITFIFALQFVKSYSAIISPFLLTHLTLFN